jgi:hypothetical protein
MELHKPTEYVRIVDDLEENDMSIPLLVNQSNPESVVVFGSLSERQRKFVEENGYTIEDSHEDSLSFTVPRKPDICCDYPMVTNILQTNAGSVPTSPQNLVRTKCTQCGKSRKEHVHDDRL